MTGPSQVDLASDLRILDRLESEELPLLSWGFVEGGFSDDELLDLLDGLAEESGDNRSAEQIRDSLQDRAFLTRVEASTSAVWRTRMGETARLLVRLRQLFPRDLESGEWRTAPNLVSDYRFLARPRQFPIRNLAPDAMVAAARATEAAPAVIDAVETLVSGSQEILYSAFQVRAVTAILRGARVSSAAATLVAAGTGSGKTKAFYIPALAEISQYSTSESWTKLLAVYPRNELLKDQLKTALREARELRKKLGKRLRLGAFYGDTPLFSQYIEHWERAAGAFVCPMLSCPECDGRLLLASADSHTPLTCETCGGVVSRDELMLTRGEMQDQPPDVLMTTTETLNRQISNDYSRHVFGVGVTAERTPRFLLLDEAHTYSGLYGAQTALLLRRWRHAVGRPVHTVGLTATIVDGAEFMASLAGVEPPQVSVVEPQIGELTQEGKEYLLAARGDPASSAALLSTTIQAAMLLRRTLARREPSKSPQAYGSKLFVFTDDLDLTNRLLHFLRDAEGQDDAGRPKAATHKDAAVGSLANLRDNLRSDYRERLAAGQAWDIAREIGHSLLPAERLNLARTSSQDKGLQRDADIVVATASLEVGLDDETVGGVIQHKAARDAAQFIQRRGRAGRTRVMRPWTLVVLSDYGRDRLAFQAWDELFDPRLRPSRLPVGNRYVLRIQATFSLLDWLSIQLRRKKARQGSVWQDLKGPDQRYDPRRRIIEGELLRLMTSQDARDELKSFISQSLRLSDSETDRLLWDPPRAVLASVVPTLYRRVESGWLRRAGGTGQDLIAEEPMPDFLPGALFEDLLLPEVQIQPADDGTREENMGVQQALREFAPGRVTHRFAIGRRGERLWVAPGDENGDVDVRSIAVSDPLIRVYVPGVGGLSVFRPWKLMPVRPPTQIASSSNARPIWHSQLVPMGRTLDRFPPPTGPWNELVASIQFHIHRAGGRVQVTRASLGSEATVNTQGTSRILTTRFVDGSEPVALGFKFDVDALSVTVKDPGGWAEVSRVGPKLYRGLRLDWFRHCLNQHSALRSSTSVFKRDWLAELTMAALARTAVEGGTRLPDAVKSLKEASLSETLDDVLQVVFQSIDPTSVTGAEAAEEINVTRLHRDLVALAAQESTIEAVHQALDEMVESSGSDFERWLRDRFLSTVAGCLVSASAAVHPDGSAEELLVDLGEWNDDTCSITISETNPGGVGVVEGIFDAFHRDPRRFWRLVSASADPSELEVLDRELTRVAALAARDEEISELFAILRGADSNSERATAWNRLTRALDRKGVALTHSVRIAMGTRLFRPSTSRSTDQLLADLIRRWEEREETLGIELDARIYAYIASGDAEVVGRLGEATGMTHGDRTWAFNAILSLLWPRGRDLRSRPLQVWQPYASLPAPDRALLSDRVGSTAAQVFIDPSRPRSEKAAERTRSLEESGAAVLFVDHGGRETRKTLLDALVQPVDVGVLELHPRIVGVRRADNRLAIELELPEVLG